MVAVDICAIGSCQRPDFSSMEVLHVEVRSTVPDMELSVVGEGEENITAVGAYPWPGGALANGVAAELYARFAEGLVGCVEVHAHQIVADLVVVGQHKVGMHRVGVLRHDGKFSAAVKEAFAIWAPVGIGLHLVLCLEDIRQCSLVGIEEDQV
ncbi:hypothetical protein EVA_02309 [gut metagenome]|uniref:Uncharacterized protein n=1 Tax=gut metagenome TaxID=749906 RepID=J9H6A8_9ZZZZ